MKKIILAVVALMATCTLSAQDLRVGLTGGLNFANLHYSQTNSSDGYLGINLGIKVKALLCRTRLSCYIGLPPL